MSRDTLTQLERQLQERIQSVSRRATAFPKLTFFVLLVVLAALIALMLIQTGRLETIETNLRQSIAEEVGSRHADALPPEAVARMTEKLDYLRLRQDAVLDEARNSLERLYLIFGSVAAFFGILSLYFGYRQLSIESRRDENRDRNDQEMRNLVRSFQENITTISSLISTLEQSFAYRKQIEDQLTAIDERAVALEKQHQESHELFHGLVLDLNTEAVRIFDPDTDRSRLSVEESRRRLEQFANRMRRLETSRNVDRLLNPVCYYLRGLADVSIYQYEAAIEDLKRAHTAGKADLGDPRLSTYAEQDRESARETISRMLVLCSYFQGVGYKNLEQYPESRDKFREALDRDPRHLESLGYLLQVAFFDINVPFEQIERDYDGAFKTCAALRESEFDEDRLARCLSTFKVNQGNLYLEKAIPLEFRSGYSKYENPDKAFNCYREAYEIRRTSLTAFSLAQAMERVGASQWRRRTPTELYQESMGSLNRQVAEDHDRLYAVMLYYMLAICASKVKGATENARIYLTQARHSLQEVPGHVTCFSPISKIRLRRPQTLEEMEKFERSL